MRLGPRKTSLLLAAATAAAGALWPAAALGAGIGGFSVRPGDVNPANPATRAYFIRTVRPGGSFTDHVVVSVPGPAVQLRVYPVDGLTGATSGAVYSNRGVPLYKAGRWITTAQSLVTVGPDGQRSVAFTVHVPQHVKPGDHLAGIALEGAHPRTSSGKFSVTEIVRAVVGVEIVVPGAARQHVHIDGIALKALPGTQIPSLVVSLGEEGGQLCKPHLTVTIGSGAGALTVQRQLDTVLPGDEIPYPLAWPRTLKAGSYPASVKATNCGSTSSESGTVSLGTALSGTTAHPGTSVLPSRPAGGPPWWPIPLIGVGGAALGFLLARRRRPSSAPGAEHPPAPREGDVGLGRPEQ